MVVAIILVTHAVVRMVVLDTLLEQSGVIRNYAKGLQFGLLCVCAII